MIFRPARPVDRNPVSSMGR